MHYRSKMFQLSRRVIHHPVRIGLQSMSSKAKNNEYFYQTDFSHASVVLGETTASMVVDQKLQTMNPDYAPHNFVNNRMERMNLRDAKGGKVEMHRDLETGIAEIVLSNPEKANAISGSMMVELADIIHDLESWDEGKAVILCGDPEGLNFSGGVDIGAIQRLGSKQGGMMCLFMQNVLSRLQRLPLISVAAIQGNAVGGGAELTVACDFRVMHPDASFQFIQGKMGLSPGFGGGTRLVRLVGPRTALKMLTSAQILSSSDALSLGLSDATLSETSDLSKEACDWLSQYISAPSAIVRAMKNVVRYGSELPLDQALQREKQVFTGLWGGSLQRKAFAKIKGN